MTEKFSQEGVRSSMEGWTGDFSSVEAVQEADSRELETIAGSYEAIARRMQEMWDFANRFTEARKDIVPYEEWTKVIDPVLDRFEEKYGEHFNRGTEAWKSYLKEWARLRASFPSTHLDDKVAVLQYLGTRGFQVCPFEPCDVPWNEDVQVLNRKNGRQLTINRGTIHLAKEHHFFGKRK